MGGSLNRMDEYTVIITPENATCVNSDLITGGPETKEQSPPRAVTVGNNHPQYNTNFSVD